MVVGGNSLLTGFVDRLNYEFNHLNYKTKIFAMPTVTERRFSSWIGGSILGSLVNNYSFFFVEIFNFYVVLRELFIKCGYRNKNMKRMVE